MAAMGKLLNQRTAIKLLRKHGWTQSVGGRHNVKMTKPGCAVTLPQHRGCDYSRGLTLTILKQAGIDPREL